MEVDRVVGAQANHDVMLHVYGSTSRTIAYKKAGDAYIWLGEQETHTGPNEYMSEGFRRKEEITITYDKVYLSGAPLNQVLIDYDGDDPRLAGKFDLTLEDVQPILNEWRSLQKP